MVGQGGLRDVEFLEEDAGAFFAGAQQLQDAQAVFVAERLEDPRAAGVAGFQNGPPRIEKRRYEEDSDHIDDCQCEAGKDQRIAAATAEASLAASSETERFESVPTGSWKPIEFALAV